MRPAKLACHVVLDHGTKRAPARRIDKFNNSYVHAFALAAPDDADARVLNLLREAHACDRKRHG